MDNIFVRILSLKTYWSARLWYMTTHFKLHFVINLRIWLICALKCLNKCWKDSLTSFLQQRSKIQKSQTSLKYIKKIKIPSVLDLPSLHLSLPTWTLNKKNVLISCFLQLYLCLSNFKFFFLLFFFAGRSKCTNEVFDYHSLLAEDAENFIIFFRLRVKKEKKFYW